MITRREFSISMEGDVDDIVLAVAIREFSRTILQILIIKSSLYRQELRDLRDTSGWLVVGESESGRSLSSTSLRQYSIAYSSYVRGG